MKLRVLSLYPGLRFFTFVCCFSFFGCLHSPNKVNEIGLNDGEVPILEWMLIGPFKFDESLVVPDSSFSENFGIEEDCFDFDDISKMVSLAKESDFDVVEYVSKRDFIDLNSVFNCSTSASCYAVAQVFSDVDQEVALLFGGNDRVTLWLNNELLHKDTVDNILKKNDKVVSANLKKGENLILIRICNTSTLWQFSLSLCDPAYVHKYRLLKGYSSLFDHYFHEELDSLRFKSKPFFDKGKMEKLSIFDVADSLVVSYEINAFNNPNFNFSLKEGIYKFVLQYDSSKIVDYVIVGERDRYTGYSFLELSREDISKKELMNLDVLKRRIRSLVRYGNKNGFTSDLERKLAMHFYEYFRFLERINNYSEDAYKDDVGRHIYSFVSSIDSNIRDYMLYVPPQYQKGDPIPLVVDIPFVLGRKSRFVDSWHVANIDRIEYICDLADYHGFAYLWTNPRIYEKYNLNPIVDQSIFEVLEDVENSYEIDSSRIYLYGSCSGGLNALLFAVRYPNKFAAIGVEGPELHYVFAGDDMDADWLPREWVERNNILNYISNISNTPLYIISSKNDVKSDYEINKEIVKTLNRNNGFAVLDEVNNPTKNRDISLMSENYNLEQIFSFFRNKKKKEFYSLIFSTHQLKYNKTDWITIDRISLPNMATISAHFSDNHLFIDMENVEKLTVHLNRLPRVKSDELIKISINSIDIGNVPFSDHEFIYESTTSNAELDRMIKTDKLEGPINHAFSEGFVVVQGSNCNDSLLDIASIFSDSWKESNWGTCSVVMDYNIDDEIISKNHLVICHTLNSNLLFNKLQDKLPIKISENDIQLGRKKVKGNNLIYQLIYPNPLNTGKYVVLIGSNSSCITKAQVENLCSQGWFDYQIFRSGEKNPILFGYFNACWEL